MADKGKPIKVVPICALDKESLSPSFDELVDLALPNLPLATTTTSQTPPTSLYPNGTLNGEHKEKAGDKEKAHDKDKNANGEKASEKAAEKTGEKSADGKDGKKKKGKKLASVESGFESVQNRRKTMEDKHVIMDNFRVCPLPPLFAPPAPQFSTPLPPLFLSSSNVCFHAAWIPLRHRIGRRAVLILRSVRRTRRRRDVEDRGG